MFVILVLTVKETSKKLNQLRKQLAHIDQLEQRASSTVIKSAILTMIQSEWLTDEQTAKIFQKHHLINEIEQLKGLQADGNS